MTDHALEYARLRITHRGCFVRKVHLYPFQRSTTQRSGYRLHA